MTLRRDEAGKSAILPTLIVLVVLVLFAWQVGLLNQFLVSQPPPGPDGQTFAITISGFSDPVASSVSTVSTGVRVEATNIVLSNGGGDYTATFNINVRDTKTGDQQGAHFTMKVVVGNWMSPTGFSWPILVKDSAGLCSDITYSVVAGGSGVETACDAFYGSIDSDGGAVSINVAIQVNGDLFGTGLPPTGTRISLTFGTIGASDASVVWVPTG